MRTEDEIKRFKNSLRLIEPDGLVVRTLDWVLMSSTTASPGDMLDRPVSELGLRGQSTGSLRHHGITLIRQLTEMTEEDVKRINNFGPMSLHRLRAALASHGLSLKYET